MTTSIKRNIALVASAALLALVSAGAAAEQVGSGSPTATPTQTTMEQVGSGLSTSTALDLLLLQASIGL